MRTLLFSLAARSIASWMLSTLISIADLRPVDLMRYAVQGDDHSINTSHDAGNPRAKSPGYVFLDIFTASLDIWSSNV
jgi:hypothetical protein